MIRKIYSFYTTLFCCFILCSQGLKMTVAEPAKTLEKILKAPPGWSSTDFQADYRSNNLHEYLNGGAERYLGYGFEQLLVREFVSSNRNSRIRVELYLMDSPANAFGIFSSDRGGEKPVGVGQDAALGEYLLQFWQSSYFVRIQDFELEGGLRESLLSFGRLISSQLPEPLAEDRPKLLSVLPAEGLIESSVCYFHTQNSLNSLIYLSEENLLGLGPETKALSAEYKTGEKSGIVRCLVIQYPTQQACGENLSRFLSSRDKLTGSSRKELSHVSVNANYLLALFGPCNPEWIRRFESKLWKNI